jgi:hypothetical protein
MLAAAALWGAGGCAATLNERLAVGTRPTPSFGGWSGPGMAGPGTLDRRQWPTMIVVTPVDGVVHGETFRTMALVSRRAGADRAGVFPLPESGGAGESSLGWDAAVTVREFGRGMADPWLAPWRGWRAWAAGGWTWSPMEIWKRTRQDRARSAAVGGVRRKGAQDG